ncbi:SusC/RagA family TonB-linked outer membrane protein [Parasediminibacterium sp. JCM 36343]|uniref:SusC/RagA family TonB-linked outer membrane protein n=1 Tax=Parasediminibacterium sp. JCM 36343 TaxID=3374279 RepID=UPI00397A8E91
MKKKQRKFAMPLFAMKTTFLQISLFIFFCSVLYAYDGNGQSIVDKKLTLKVNNAPLKRVIKLIESQLFIKFGFSGNAINASQKLTFAVKDKLLKDFLDIEFVSLHIGYKVVNNQLILYPIEDEKKKLAVSVSVDSVKSQPLKKITGQVLNEKGEPLELASVKLKGSNKTVTTKKDGTFAIEVAPSENPVLIFSFVGYASAEVAIGQRSYIAVSLKLLEKNLDDVIVVGYGQVKRRDVTGSVSKVNMSDLQKAPVKSFDEALAGRIAGVQVASQDGQPGSPISIIIRGNNSITQDNSPLYVIDGFPVEDPNNNLINPAEIESIEVLKDASSTAIYGARGANGVIIITTKKGKEGAPIINYTTTYGSQRILKKMQMMSPYEFVKLQTQIDTIANPLRYFQNGLTLESYKNVAGLKMQDLVFRPASMINNTVSIAGGTLKTKYFLSGSVLSQDGIVINSSYKRYQSRFSLDQTINDKLKIGINTNISSVKYIGTTPSQTDFNGSLNLMYGVLGYRPVTGSISNYLVDNLFDTAIVLLNDYRYNPSIELRNEMRNNMDNNIISNLYLDYAILPTLKLRITAGINYDIQRADAFNNSNTVYGNTQSPVGSSGPNGSINYAESFQWLNENTLTYNKKISENQTINVLAGITFQKHTNAAYGFSAIHVPDDALGVSGLNQGTPTFVASYNSLWTLNSFLSRVNYAYKSRYLLTASLRDDGSSKFGASNKWGLFPSGAVAWRFTSEPFMPKNDWLNEGKLRFSYGITGNNRVGDFAPLSQENLGIAAGYPFNNLLTNGVNNGAYPSVLGNPNLKWESTRQADLGIDLTGFKQKVNLTIDYYSKTTYNLLLNANLPFTEGYGNVFENIGKVRNSGLEITISTTNISTPTFTWNSSFNISFNRSKVLQLTQNQESLSSFVSWDGNYNGLSPYIAKTNLPISQLYGYVWDGVYQKSDFTITPSGKYILKDNVTDNGNARNQIQPGDIKYKDLSGDRTINANDLAVIGRGEPIHVGGFTNNFTYKGFDLNIFFQWSYGNDIINANRLKFDGSNIINLNQFTTYQNRWTPQNTNTNIFRVGGQGPYAYSSRIVEDGSYIRLKTVSIGYNLPVNVIKKAKLKTARIFLSAQNVFTISKYSGFDPEVSVRNSALTPGFDYSSYPRARTISAGASISF